MRRSLPQRCLLEFLAAVFLLGVVTPAQATLCVAAGGHLAVELADALCCHTEAPMAGTTLREGSKCGDGCVDTPLKAWVAARDSTGSGSILWTQPGAASAMMPCEGLARAIHARIAREAPARIVSAPRLLLTAVNLC